MAKHFKNNEEPISFTCDGDCKNDNVTIQIHGGESLGHWESSYNFSTDSFILNRFSVDEVISCGCKEEIQYKSKNGIFSTKCRVWECFFKDNNFIADNGAPEDISLSNDIFTFPYLRDSSFFVSVYLQGSKTIFKGGDFFLFNIL